MAGKLVGKNVADGSGPDVDPRTGDEAATVPDIDDTQVWPPRVEHNLQVRWSAERDAWVLQPWPSHHGDGDDMPEEYDNLKVWKVHTDKDVVIDCGATLAEFIAEEWNTDRSCELVIRNKDGRIGKGSSGRRTYGVDPESSEG